MPLAPAPRPHPHPHAGIGLALPLRPRHGLQPDPSARAVGSAPRLPSQEAGPQRPGPPGGGGAGRAAPTTPARPGPTPATHRHARGEATAADKARTAARTPRPEVGRGPAPSASGATLGARRRWPLGGADFRPRGPPLAAAAAAAVRPAGPPRPRCRPGAGAGPGVQEGRSCVPPAGGAQGPPEALEPWSRTEIFGRSLRSAGSRLQQRSWGTCTCRLLVQLAVSSPPRELEPCGPVRLRCSLPPRERALLGFAVSCRGWCRRAGQDAAGLPGPGGDAQRRDQTCTLWFSTTLR
ncbi:translation initiation factor IF-2-like [Canis lupus familiaris]|uniref:translation initiation factor IF-2-like n=1 Tax=Canis lupus familiaris TaxID=9615 RepID=UPI0018F64F0E|nr:translation initiation factor IF-2-like [Canis lupus familiaris]XP_038540473.1 translation initiation factor IF-2-like [Canis lupus familiaris]XP_038544767.1 translation initiation factor IF-2-like [Canis lupus familiaris]